MQVQLFNEDDYNVPNWAIFPPWVGLATNYPNNGTYIWHVNATTRPDSNYYIYLYWDVVSSQNYSYTSGQAFQIQSSTSSSQSTSHTGLIIGVVVGVVVVALLILAIVLCVCRQRLDARWKDELERAPSERRAYQARFSGNFRTSSTMDPAQPEASEMSADLDETQRADTRDP